ncbi:MAG: LytTR family DNA-binding domain-containing protein [Blautia sp.]|nr:LytTR family DNA-binding domain-containing protein [Blautia sp.]
MLHVAICDDDKFLLEDLGREVELWAREAQAVCTVELFAAAEPFLFAWEERKDIDILLLDIEMPGMDGMELAKMLRRRGERLGIIFVTGNPDFAPDGYDLEAVSYLVKPVKRERLRAALDRAVRQSGSREALLVAVSAGEVEKVYVSEICFLESEGHETALMLRGGRRIVCKEPMRQLEQELVEGADVFFKPHRSYMINLGYVERITRKDVQMEGGTKIPIARGKHEELSRAYMRYFHEKI